MPRFSEKFSFVLVKEGKIFQWMLELEKEMLDDIFIRHDLMFFHSTTCITNISKGIKPKHPMASPGSLIPLGGYVDFLKYHFRKSDKNLYIKKDTNPTVLCREMEIVDREYGYDFPKLLDDIDGVKGWLSPDGKFHHTKDFDEKHYDLAVRLDIDSLEDYASVTNQLSYPGYESSITKPVNGWTTAQINWLKENLERLDLHQKGIAKDIILTFNFGNNNKEAI